MGLYYGDNAGMVVMMPDGKEHGKCNATEDS